MEVRTNADPLSPNEFSITYNPSTRREGREGRPSRLPVIILSRATGQPVRTLRAIHELIEMENPQEEFEIVIGNIPLSDPDTSSEIQPSARIDDTYDLVTEGRSYECTYYGYGLPTIHSRAYESTRYRPVREIPLQG